MVIANFWSGRNNNEKEKSPNQIHLWVLCLVPHPIPFLPGLPPWQSWVLFPAVWVSLGLPRCTFQFVIQYFGCSPRAPGFIPGSVTRHTHCVITSFKAHDEIEPWEERKSGKLAGEITSAFRGGGRSSCWVRVVWGEREAEAIWERNQYRDHRRSEEFKEQETSRGQLVLRAQSGADKVREERERAEDSSQFMWGEARRCQKWGCFWSRELITKSVGASKRHKPHGKHWSGIVLEKRIYTK